MTPEEITSAIRREALRLMPTLDEFAPGDPRRVVSVCDVEEMVRAGMSLSNQPKAELRWHHGPTEQDSEPGKMWCYSCGKEVMWIEDSFICLGCKATSTE